MTKYDELMRGAKIYADGYRSSEIIDPDYGKSVTSVTLQTKTIGGSEYYQIGPFNLQFSNDSIDSIVVNTNKGDITPNDYTQNDSNFSTVSKIKSGKNFYINIKADDEITKVKKVTIKSKKVDTYTADIYIYKKDGSQTINQNFAYFKAKKEEKQNAISYDLNIDVLSKGNLKVIKVDKDDNEVKLKDVEFILYNKGTKQYVQANNQYVTTGYTSKKSEATKFLTNQDGEFEVKNLTEGTYIAYETKNPDSRYVIVKDGVEKKVVADKTEELKIQNELAKGNLKVIKVDKDDNTVKLSGVGFYIQNKDTSKYVKVANGKTSYVDKKEDATEFITDKNGEILIKNLVVGTYVAYETKNPNYGYEILTEGREKEVIIDKTEELKIPNEKAYIKLSGYVWVDRQSGKKSVRNDLYKDNDYDSSDILLDGITVRLKDKTTGEVIATTKTAKGGAYSFDNILIAKLADYYVEFEYSGLTYTNVVPHTDKDNGSKAIEGDSTRTTFNNKFAEITKDTTIDGTVLEYNSSDHKSTLVNGAKFTITSTTKETPFNISEQYKSGMTEIKNINLGLYEREQPDLALVKDIENVKVTVNGYAHIYQYATRFINEGEYSGGFNAGVKFGEKYGKQTYSRAVYKSDYDYSNEDDTSKELKAYITYKIAVENQSTTLTSKVNSIVDYYDTRYTFVAAGTDINARTGEIAGDAISYTNDSYNSEYNKLVLKTDMTIEHQNQAYIYVQFSLDKKAIGSIMFDANGEEITDKILLDNVAEINSYTTYENGKIYAGVDSDSRPGNAIPGDVNTYEDDTDAAPALALELANARKITGSVFLDESVNGSELKVGEERIGNGKYDEGETAIPGVTVKMIKDDGTVVATTITDENGNFEISGFLPGNYTIVYTWGDKTYTVKDYKGTIFNDLERLGRNNWYAENMDTRYSDAIDNYDTRKLIDSGEHPEITTMDSTTPTMKFGIELYDQNTGRVLDYTSGIDKVEFLIKNLDFGIVERPRQQLDISKNATAVKITLANGQVVVDAKIENGELKGAATKGVTYEPASVASYGFIKSEIDNELIQGSTIQIEYTITVANNSEVDYDSERYYKYGIKEGNIITITPSGVYDYLDSEMVLDSSKETENADWEIKTTTEYNEEVTDPIVYEYIKEYASTTTDVDGFIRNINGYESFFEEYSEEIKEATELTLARIRETVLADKTILHNANLEGELQPGESKTVNLYTSKVLSNADEIDLNNSTEITKVERNSQTGREVTPKTSRLYDNAEEVTVTPPTGENQDYVLPIILGVSTLIILGAGVVLIKKKVLNK